MVCGTVAGVSVVHLVIVHGEMDGHQGDWTGAQRVLRTPVRGQTRLVKTRPRGPPGHTQTGLHTPSPAGENPEEGESFRLRASFFLEIFQI